MALTWSRTRLAGVIRLRKLAKSDLRLRFLLLPNWGCGAPGEQARLEPRKITQPLWLQSRIHSDARSRTKASITFQQNVSILFCFMLYWVDGRRPDEEKTHLDQLRQSRTAAFRDVQRAQILWRYHAGETVSQIASARKDDAQERSEVD
jgi:hypothetical protein